MYNGMPHPQTSYNPTGLPPGTAYNPNMPGMPPPSDYMSHHSMPGHNMTLPQQYHMPPGHAHPAGPAPPPPATILPGLPVGQAPQVHSQGVPPGHHHPGLSATQPHPQTLPPSHIQGPPQPPEQTTLPYQTQG